MNKLKYPDYIPDYEREKMRKDDIIKKKKAFKENTMRHYQENQQQVQHRDEKNRVVPRVIIEEGSARRSRFRMSYDNKTRKSNLKMQKDKKNTPDETENRKVLDAVYCMEQKETIEIKQIEEYYQQLEEEEYQNRYRRAETEEAERQRETEMYGNEWEFGGKGFDDE